MSFVGFSGVIDLKGRKRSDTNYAALEHFEVVSDETVFLRNDLEPRSLKELSKVNASV